MQEASQNSSSLSNRSVLLVEETGVPRENYRPVTKMKRKEVGW